MDNGDGPAGDTPGQPARRPKLLISNDDGIKAPGIKAIVAELLKQDFCDVTVCAPSSERSAQSHAITLGRYLSAFPSEAMLEASPGVAEAWAVDGTPADAVMLALNSPVLLSRDFDLCVSGINRGDNCGRHVIYSGTVAAAREAACAGLPALALSLDDHKARRVDDYTIAAKLCVSVVKAMLGLLPDQPGPSPLESLRGTVLNVNVPSSTSSRLRGYYLTHQSCSGISPAFKEIKEPTGAHLAQIDEHTPDSRIFRNYAGAEHEDGQEGGDDWALRSGYVSVTPLGLRSCVPSRVQTVFSEDNARVLAATAAVVKAAAADMGLLTGGIAKL
ncbi:hypothetical protein FOA52_013385 [Chlamydomonas sp. UWO 241]|nr:hypothetical protein FOA52_013385 [Chlamydomonas sp. UWO 241]